MRPTARACHVLCRCAMVLIAAPAALMLACASAGCYERVVSRTGAFTQQQPVYERAEDDLFLLRDLEEVGRELSRERRQD